MKRRTRVISAFFLTLSIVLGLFPVLPAATVLAADPPPATVGGVYEGGLNPYIPLWDYNPDTDPHVFHDPDNPGKFRLYLFNSHDLRTTAYCYTNEVLWSAPVEDLTQWTYHGVIVNQQITGGSSDDIFFAPTACEIDNGDGTYSYYFIPFSQGSGRAGMMLKADRPDGPYHVINWRAGSTSQLTTDTASWNFDPALFVDDDGRVYGYWGGYNSPINGGEMDPTAPYRLKPGTSQVSISPIYSGTGGAALSIFEAVAMSKMTIDGHTKYVMTYARRGLSSEPWGTTSAMKAYATSDNPLGPFTYGGPLVYAGGEIVNGSSTFTTHNTHGNLFEVNGQWYISYHRASNNHGYSRQAMVEAVYPYWDDVEGKLVIPMAEVTSQGFHIDGLDPYRTYSAGIACYTTGGPYVAPNISNRSATNIPTDNVVGTLNNNSLVGYKYFNFAPRGQRETYFTVDFTPRGQNGTITAFIGNPNKPADNAQQIGQISITSSMAQVSTKFKIPTPLLDDPQNEGKFPLFLRFTSASGSLGTLSYIGFSQEILTAEGYVDLEADIASTDLQTGENMPITINAIHQSGSKVDITNNPGLSVTVRDTGVVTYAGGVLTAVAIGKTFLDIEYDGLDLSIELTVGDEIDPRATMIYIDGAPLEGFTPNTMSYNYAFPNMPGSYSISATLPGSGLSYDVEYPLSIPGLAKLTVSSVWGKSVTYNINLSLVPPRLASISVGGAPVTGFDPDTFSYTLKYPYDQAAPDVTAVAALPLDHTVTYSKATTVPGSTTITVSNGATSQNYTVNFELLPPEMASFEFDGETFIAEADVFDYDVYIPDSKTSIDVTDIVIDAVNPSSTDVSIALSPLGGAVGIGAPCVATVTLSQKSDLTKLSTYTISFGHLTVGAQKATLNASDGWSTTANVRFSYGGQYYLIFALYDKISGKMLYSHLSQKTIAKHGSGTLTESLPFSIIQGFGGLDNVTANIFIWDEGCVPLTKQYDSGELVPTEVWKVATTITSGTQYIIVSARSGGGALTNTTATVPAGDGVSGTTSGGSVSGRGRTAVTIKGDYVVSPLPSAITSSSNLLWTIGVPATTHGGPGPFLGYQGYSIRSNATGTSNYLQRGSSSNANTAPLNVAAAPGTAGQGIWFFSPMDATGLTSASLYSENTDGTTWLFSLLGNANGFVGEGGNIASNPTLAGAAPYQDAAPIRLYEKVTDMLPPDFFD